jgi:hypothetical protein
MFSPGIWGKGGDVPTISVCVLAMSISSLSIYEPLFMVNVIKIIEGLNGKGCIVTNSSVNGMRIKKRKKNVQE